MKTIYTLVCCFLAFSSYAKEIDLIIYSQYTVNGYEVFATNKEDFPVLIEFDFTLKNLDVDWVSSKPIIVPPGAKDYKVLELVTIDRLEGYSLDFTHAARNANEPLEVHTQITNAGSEAQISGETTDEAGLLIEAERLSQIDQEKQLAEVVRAATIAEEKRVAELAEQERLAEEARLVKIEEERLAEEARLAKIAEEKRLAEEARQAKIAEEKRLAEIAEAKRLIEVEDQAKMEAKERIASVVEQEKVEAEERIASLVKQEKIEAEERIARVVEQEKIESEERIARIVEQEKIEAKERIARVVEQENIEAEKRIARVLEQKKIEAEKRIVKVEERARLEEEMRLTAFMEKERKESKMRIAAIGNSTSMMSILSPVGQKKATTKIKQESQRETPEQQIDAIVVKAEPEKRRLNPIPEFIVTNEVEISYKYNIPLPIGTDFTISQGYQGARSHENIFALDFAIPLGTAVHAAREGVVVYVEERQTLGCNNENCKRYENSIIIMHPDGSYAKYAHLQKNGAEVSVADNIVEGQLIGYSGDTGWTDAPSLHFEVFFQGEDNTKKTIKTNFKMGDGSDYSLLFERQAYTKEY